jgi:hypothetical protein
MDRLAQLSTIFLVGLVLGLILHEWTTWSSWTVAFITASAALLAGHLTRAWWADYANRHRLTIYKEE